MTRRAVERKNSLRLAARAITTAKKKMRGGEEGEHVMVLRSD